MVAFITVSVGVIILRVREPNLERPFKVPGYPVTPILSVLACMAVLYGLRWQTWLVFGACVAAVLVFYLVWGRRHSALNDGGDGYIPTAVPGEDDVHDRPIRRDESNVTVVVGYLAGKSGRSALHLAVEAAHTLNTVAGGRHRRAQAVDDAVACAHRRRIRHVGRPVGRGLTARGEAVPRPDTGKGLEVSFHKFASRTAGEGLLDAAEELGAQVLVTGSSSDGALGQVVLGSTTDWLLHSSPIPVAISPRGYRGAKSGKLIRVTCAYSGTPESVEGRRTRRRR